MNTFPKTLQAILLLVLLTLSPAHAVPGDLDPLDANIVGNSVTATAAQPDGKIILAGSFTSVLGVPRNNIARLNADGTLDMSFDPNANDDIRTVAVQADGKVLLGGQFSTLQPNGAGAATSRQYIARVNSDGTLDMSFDPTANDTVNSAVVQADGKVLLGGHFTTLQPNGAVAATSRQYIARVNADGTLDTEFDPNANSGVLSVVVQADGKVLLGGVFTTLQPNGAGAATSRQYIARVNADGTLDPVFDPKANSYVFSVAMQADGKVLLGGNFTTLQPNGVGATTVRNFIARVNADGTLDAGFNPKASNFVTSVAVQADGKVLLSGAFITLQPNGASAFTYRRRIARLHASGALNTSFNPNASDTVFGVAVQADGKVLLGGQFTTLQLDPRTRNFFARLVNDPVTQTLTAPDRTQALWERGGAAPELSRVTFELSDDGGTSWGAPLAATRIGTTANWQLTGLSLPASGHLRARGVTNGGHNNGSSGLIEQVVAFTATYTPLQQWKLTHLGNASAPDLGDPDGDGVATLAEYGIATLPQTPDAAPHPASRFTYPEGERLRLFLQRDPTHNDVTVAVEAADTLAGPWSPLATSTLGAPFTGPGYVGGDAATPGVKTVEIRDTVNIADAPGRFMRVRVTAAP